MKFPLNILCAIGLALYSAGCARGKNTVSALFRALIVITAGLLAFWAIGQAIRTASLVQLLGWDHGLDSTDLISAESMLVGALAVSAAITERSRAYVAFFSAVILCGVLLPLTWRTSSSQWLRGMEWYDFGASWLYVATGCAAAVAVKMVGPRNGKYNQDGSTNNILGHSAPLSLIGVFLLLFAWPMSAFGSVFGVFGSIDILLTASAATLAAAAYSQFRFNRLDLLIICTGCLGGLVAGSAGYFWSLNAVVIGVVAGILVPWSAILLDLKFKMDDPINAVAIFGVGGILAGFAAVIFTPDNFVPTDRLHRLAVEPLGVGLIAVISVVVCVLFFGALRATIGLRSKPADELDGLDLAEHDANAYPDFQQTLIKSYHLREM